MWRQPPRLSKRGRSPAPAALLSLPQIINHSPHQRAAVSPGNSRKKCQKRSEDLRPRRLHCEDQIRNKLRQRDERSHHHHPPPRPARTQRPQQHARSQHQQSSKEQVINSDVRPPSTHPPQRRQQIEPSIAASRSRHLKRSAISTLALSTQLLQI